MATPSPKRGLMAAVIRPQESISPEKCRVVVVADETHRESTCAAAQTAAPYGGRLI